MIVAGSYVIARIESSFRIKLTLRTVKQEDGRKLSP